MSAQPASFEPVVDLPEPEGPRLTLLPTPKPILSGFGFGVLMAFIAAVGLAAVMVVSTSVASQSRDLTALRKEATELGYVAAALTHDLQSTSSTSSLALRASEIGMVPNPYPVFIHLADGSILGEPVPVKGDEVTYLRRLPEAAPLPDRTAVVLPETEAAAEEAEEVPVADAAVVEEPAADTDGITVAGEDPAAPEAADGAIVLPASEEEVIEQ